MAALLRCSLLLLLLGDPVAAWARGDVAVPTVEIAPGVEMPLINDGVRCVLGERFSFETLLCSILFMDFTLSLVCAMGVQKEAPLCGLCQNASAKTKRRRRNDAA